MLDHALLKQLNHPDPERRKQAVMSLAKTQDRAALPYLAEVHQSDKNAEIRELARKAGVFIVKQGKQRAAPVSTYDDDMDYEDDNYQDDYLLDDEDSGAYNKVKNDDFVPAVSDLDRERAEGLVRQALDVHMRGDNKRAMKYLKQAIEKNPALARDGYTRGVVSNISGLPVEQALASLSLETHQNSADATQKSTWQDALVELALYFFIQTGFTAILAFISIAIVSATILPDMVEDIELPNTMTIMQSIDAVGIMGKSALSGFVSTLFIFISCLVLHPIARFIFRGKGTLPHLIVKLAVPMAIASIIYTLVRIGIGYLIIDEYIFAFFMTPTDLAPILQSYLISKQATTSGAVSLTLYMGSRVSLAYGTNSSLGIYAMGVYILLIIAFIIGLMILMPDLFNELSSAIFEAISGAK